MIKINLLGEEEEFGISNTLQIGLLAATVVIVLGICIGVHQSVSNDLQVALDQKSDLDLELTKLKRITKEVEGLEAKKKLLRQKLTTISLLKVKKQGPVRVLDDLNKALPDRAWLDSAKEKQGFIEAHGVALDNQTIAQFMAQLSTSKYFGETKLVHSTQAVKDNVKLKEFLLMIELRNPLEEQQRLQAEKIKAEAEKAKKDEASVEASGV